MPKFINLGETAHSYETVIPHDEWDEIKILIEKDPRDSEPSIELEIDVDPKKKDAIKLKFSEWKSITKIMNSYEDAERKMQGAE